MEYTNLPDLDGWAALRAVVEKGGVSEAARVLHIGQPAVTKRLRALEDSYGLPLMLRVGGRLKLTEAGEKVYQLAAQTLDRHYVLREELARLAKGEDSLRLMITFTIGEYFLSGLLLQFAERHPDYKVDSRLAYSRAIETHLATGRADMGLLEIAPDHPDILVQKWLDDELWLVCGANHPLTGTNLLPVEELSKQNYVLRERRASTRKVLEEALHGIGINKLKVAFEIGSNEPIINMLAHGKHVSFLPRFAVYDHVKESTLYHIKVTGFRVMRTLWIARHRSHLDNPVADAFITMLREG